MKKIKGLFDRCRYFGVLRTMLLGIFSVLPKSFQKGYVRLLHRIVGTLGIKRLFLGVNRIRLVIDVSCPWAFREYFLNGRYDESEIESVRKNIPSDYAMFDIGANYGAWTFSLARHFKSVTAIEPDPRCFACLELTKSKTGVEGGNIHLLQGALSDHDGKAQFFVNSTHSGDGRIYDPGDGRHSGASVPLMTFDHLAESLDLKEMGLFVKLDVQGVEAEVIRGMQRTLSSARDFVLYTEVQESVLAQRGMTVQQYFDFLRARGFYPVDLAHGMKELAWTEAEKVLARQKDLCFRIKKER